MTNTGPKSLLATTTLMAVLLFVDAGVARGQAEQVDMPVDAATRTRVIEAVLRRLNESYVFPEVAAQMEQSIRARLRRGEYDRISSSAALALTLTAHLAEVAKDKHLGVGYRHEPVPAPPDRSRPSPEDREKFRRLAAAVNFGFERVERLSGNVGYMELDGFVDPELGAETAVAAMQFLANTDALIIDLRYNGGGVPGLAQLISSYFFSGRPLHLHSIYWREGDRTEQFWTLPHVPGQRYVDKPVYILMSRRTLSAPESFAYDLQALKRATVVGEVSAGGANPGREFRVDEHFVMFVPTGRAINPVTGTNWEGTGVRPDIEAPATRALKAAHLAALRRLLETSTSDGKKEQLKSIIEEVEKQP